MRVTLRKVESEYGKSDCGENETTVIKVRLTLMKLSMTVVRVKMMNLIFRNESKSQILVDDGHRY